jgi:hypothetical protein
MSSGVLGSWVVCSTSTAAPMALFSSRSQLFVTARHVLGNLGLETVGARTWIDSLDGEHRVLPRASSCWTRKTIWRSSNATLRSWVRVLCLAVSNVVSEGTQISVTECRKSTNQGREYRYLQAQGRWAGASERTDLGVLDRAIRIARIESSAVVPGMSGAPIVRLSDQAVLGVLSERYHSDGHFMRDTAWVVRCEDLLALLARTPNVRLRRILRTGMALTTVAVVFYADRASWDSRSGRDLAPKGQFRSRARWQQHFSRPSITAATRRR